MQLVPNRFLFRVCHPCPHVEGIPDDDEELFHLPDSSRLETFADMDGRVAFADVRVAWNRSGLAVQVEVRGKDQPLVGDETKPRLSDGLSLWIDTRDSRTSHRASRFCHQFHFLPTGGGPEREDPVFVQSKINRAQQDAPLATLSAVPFRSRRRGTGYRLAAFLPAEVLSGFDPEQNPRLGIFYCVRDAELGEQTLGAATDMPYAEDPTLWSVLELTGDETR
jgi:hypothetical protein